MYRTEYVTLFLNGNCFFESLVFYLHHTILYVLINLIYKSVCLGRFKLNSCNYNLKIDISYYLIVGFELICVNTSIEL